MEVGAAGLRPGEIEAGRHRLHRVLRVAECRLRNSVGGQAGAFLLGVDSLQVRGDTLVRLLRGVMTSFPCDSGCGRCTPPEILHLAAKNEAFGLLGN